VGSRGYASGFQGLISYINSQIPTNEFIGEALRSTQGMYPELAIRELVANIIVHQDFSIKGTSPMIEIFSDRMEFSNPGAPLIDVLRFVDHTSLSRNEKLAKMMRKLGICEERGSGIDKVILQCEFYQLPAPKFEKLDDSMRVVLLSPKSLREMTKDDKVRSTYLHSCLMRVSNSYMTNETLRKRFQISDHNYPMASRIIADTLEEGLIKLSDTESKSRKYARYIPFWS
jgi:predicted HTH transcriptional regulator